MSIFASAPVSRSAGDYIDVTRWNAEIYTKLSEIDALFHYTTGHDHSAADKGKPIIAAGIGTGAITPIKTNLNPSVVIFPTTQYNESRSDAFYDITNSIITINGLTVGDKVLVIYSIVGNQALGADVFQFNLLNPSGVTSIKSLVNSMPISNGADVNITVVGMYTVTVAGNKNLVAGVRRYSGSSYFTFRQAQSSGIAFVLR